MAYDFLTEDQRAVLSGDFDTVFQTLSNGRNIIVEKEPIKTLVSLPPSSAVFGFGESQQEAIYNYTPVSGIFPAVIMYGHSFPSPMNPEINVRSLAGPITVKIRQDCRDFIMDGQTRYIIADNIQFIMDGEPRRQLFLNGVYYFLSLKATK